MDATRNERSGSMTGCWPLHTLVFDLDDTLFAERDYVASGLRAVGDWIYSELGASGFAGIAWDLFVAGKRGHIFEEALIALDLKTEAAFVRGLVEVYRNHSPDIHLLPDACEILEWATSRFALAVISDGYLVSQQHKIAALGVARRVPTIFLTDAWGRDFWKPATRAFEEVMTTFPGERTGYLYVGDNPHKDFIAPRALGWRTVRVRHPGGEHAGYEAQPAEEAELEISALDELKTRLCRWEGCLEK